MLRKVTNIDIGGDMVRCCVRIFGDPCEQASDRAKIEQFALFRAVSESPDLTACAFSPFETLRMFHNGSCWVIEAEAHIHDPQGLINASKPTVSTQ